MFLSFTTDTDFLADDGTKPLDFYYNYEVRLMEIELLLRIVFVISLHFHSLHCDRCLLLISLKVIVVFV